MITLEGKFRIVTPLFMSGADRERAELRAASIRGILRFWWRALALGHCEGSWEDVRKAEFDLFGSSTTGQSRVHLSLSAPDQSEKMQKIGNLLKDSSGNVLGPGARYLGYGVILPLDKKDERGKVTNRLGEALRPYLQAPLEGDLRLYLRPTTYRKSSGNLDKKADLLEGALKAMGLIGGLGSRSRRGFGSFTLLKLKRDGVLKYEAPKNVEDYIASLRSFFQTYVKAIPEIPDYTAFNQDTRVYLLATGKDPLQLLDEIGQAMQMYRSWGRNNMVNDDPAEQNFDDDHDNMRDALFAPAREYPRRVAFGLPHNYYFSSERTNFSKPVIEIYPEKKDRRHDRRASPLFIHIQYLSKDKYAAFATIFPSLFLPKGEGILIRRAKEDGEDKRSVPQNTLQIKSDWHSILREFVEKDVPGGKGEKRFSDLKQICPEVATEESA